MSNMKNAHKTDRVAKWNAAVGAIFVFRRCTFIFSQIDELRCSQSRYRLADAYFKKPCRFFRTAIGNPR